MAFSTRMAARSQSEAGRMSVSCALDHAAPRTARRVRLVWLWGKTLAAPRFGLLPTQRENRSTIRWHVFRRSRVTRMRCHRGCPQQQCAPVQRPVRNEVAKNARLPRSSGSRALSAPENPRAASRSRNHLSCISLLHPRNPGATRPPTLTGSTGANGRCCYYSRPALGDSSTVELRTLTPSILVRIQVPQPTAFLIIDS